MGAPLRVRVLGPFEVEGVAPSDIGSRKARTLLKMLVLARGAPVAVDRIIEWLWEDLPARPEDQVSVLVSRLRRRFGTERLVRGDAGYRLVVDWLDLDVAEDLVAETEARLKSCRWRQAHSAASAALELLRGPLLADDPDAELAGVDRHSADRLVGRARRAAARAALAVGDHAAAVEHAVAALDHDDLDEDALRLVMAAQARAGRPGAGLRVYAETRARLGEELGIVPDTATEAVHDAIVTGAPLPTDVLGIPTATKARAVGLLGRDADHAVLDQVLAAVEAGGVEALTVVAEPGMGRTALVSAWCESVADRVTVLAGRPGHPGHELALQVILDVLTTHLRSRHPDEVDALLGAETEMLAPLLSLGTTRARIPAPADVEGSRIRVFAALTALVQRITEPAPAVFVVDDAHLADQASIDWINFLTRRLDGASGVLIVTTAETGAHDGLPGVVHVLAPLSVEAAAGIVGSDRATELHHLTGGNPLYLHELADWEPGRELPASLTEAIASRCRRIGDEATLSTAAVLGNEIDLDLLANVLRRHPAELLDELERGVHHGVLAEQGTGFVFRHGVVRDALADSVSSPRRALAHREAAAALAARRDSPPLAIAWHARLGGDVERAAAALMGAARAAEQRADFSNAAARAEEAVRMRDGVTERLLAARLQITIGDHDRAAGHASAALRMGGGAEAMAVAGWAAYYHRDFVAARRLAADGSRLADDDATRASCTTLEGRVLHADGELAGAGKLLMRALDLATGPTEMVASIWLGCVRCHEGRIEEAMELLRPGIHPGGADAHPFAPLHALMFTAYGLGIAGRPGEALRTLDLLDEEVRRRDAARFAGRSDNVRGWVLRNVGAAEEAADLHAAAVEAASAVGGTEAHGHGLLDLAELALTGGDLDRATRLLEEAEPLLGSPHVFAWRHELRARLLRARVDLMLGNRADALGQALELAEDSRRLGVRRYETLADAAVSVAAGRPNDAGPRELDRLVARLVESAALESWWLVADLGLALGLDRLARRAEDQVETLAADLPPERREVFERVARARLDRTASI